MRRVRRHDRARGRRARRGNDPHRLDARDRPGARAGVSPVAWCGGTWLLYAALSNNYSGPCCSIRWFVPFLAPAYYVLALLLKRFPEYRWDFYVLSGWGAVLGIREDVDHRRSRARADRELRALRRRVVRRQDAPALECLREVDPVLDGGLRVVRHQDHRVVREEAVSAAGRLDSLNLAVATALVLYEIRREQLRV